MKVLLVNLSWLVVVLQGTSCSTPGAGPSPGQQAVLARTLSYNQNEQKSVESQMLFMRNFQAMTAQRKQPIP